MKRYHRRRFFWLPGSLNIFGYEDDSEHEEDHELIDTYTKSGRVFGLWFSEAVPDGEMGTNPIENLVEISEEEFEIMRSRGWQLPPKFN